MYIYENYIKLNKTKYKLTNLIIIQSLINY